MWSTRKTVEINDPKKDQPSKKPIKYNWNHVLPSLVCCVGFSIIFGFMLYFTIEEIKEEKFGGLFGPNFDRPNVKNNQKYYTYSSKCEISGECSITCSGITSGDDISALVQESYESFPGSDCGNIIKKLAFKSTVFPENRLKSGWLTSPVIKIQCLQIMSSKIETIEKDAFKDAVFKDMSVFTLEEIKFDVWTNDQFEGLVSLKLLNVRDSQILVTEPDSLSPVSESITQLQIQQIVGKFNPLNITGTNNFGSIILVDFRYNNFGSLNKEMFRGVTSCIQLYLNYGEIQHIEEETFKNMRKLELLDLSYNKLVYLSSNVLLTSNPRLFIYIASNDWDCACNLKWLQTMLSQGQVRDIPLCDTPDAVKEMPFDQVEFCPNNSTTSQQMSTTIEMTTFTVNHPSTPMETFIEIICHIMPSSGIIDGRNSNEYGFTVSTQIACQTVDFIINDIGDGIVSIDILSDQDSMDILIWFSGRMDSGSLINASVGCVTNLTSGVRVEKLKSGEPYTFCLLQESERKISPFNCRAHITSMPWKFRAFLRNEDIPAAAGIVSVSLIFFMLLGAVIIFLVVRRNPSLLRGSKRIVMVKHRTAEALVLPPKITESEDKDKKGPPAKKSVTLRRSVSETSVFSGRSVDASYISAAEPTPVQLLHWRLEQLRSSVETSSHSARVIPPPLPPRVPKKSPCSPPIPADFDSLSGISEV